MKPALSVPILGAAVFAVGALVYRLGQGRCGPERVLAGAGSSVTGSGSTGPRATNLATLPEPASETVTSLLDRLREQGF